jgi:hypothetical protein
MLLWKTCHSYHGCQSSPEAGRVDRVMKHIAYLPVAPFEPRYSGCLRSNSDVVIVQEVETIPESVNSDAGISREEEIY